jgi:hypothetical protein
MLSEDGSYRTAHKLALVIKRHYDRYHWISQHSANLAF